MFRAWYLYFLNLRTPVYVFYGLGPAFPLHHVKHRTMNDKRQANIGHCWKHGEWIQQQTKASILANGTMNGQTLIWSLVVFDGVEIRSSPPLLGTVRREFFRQRQFHWKIYKFQLKGTLQCRWNKGDCCRRPHSSGILQYVDRRMIPTS